MEARRIYLTPNLIGPIIDNGDTIVLDWRPDDDEEREMSREAFYERFPYALENRCGEKSLQESTVRVARVAKQRTGIASWF